LADVHLTTRDDLSIFARASLKGELYGEEITKMTICLLILFFIFISKEIAIWDEKIILRKPIKLRKKNSTTFSL
jgi:hypothetical protein